MVIQFLAGFFILLLLGVPIAFTLGISAVCLLVTGDVFSPILVSQRVFIGLNSFPLMAIPFFVLAGELMEKGRLTQRLATFAKSLVYHIWGGLGHVIVITGMLFSAISGSGSATTAAIGSVLFSSMHNEGYDRDYSGALIAAAGSIGPIIPPSIGMIIYGVTTNTSVAQLFLSGILPGILCGGLFMAINYYYARKNNYPRGDHRAPIKDIYAATKNAIGPIMLPIIIFGGIFGGVFTPTEAAAVASVYALLLSLFIYKSISACDLPAILIKTVKTTSMVVLIIAFASPVGWAMANQRLPQIIAEGMLQLSSNPLIIMMIINIFLLIVGMFLDAITAVVLLAPVFLAVVQPMGISPLLFGLIMNFNLAIGQITPPVGLCLYVSCPIVDTTLEKISRRIVPFVLAEILVLALIILFPKLFMYIPMLIN